MNIRDILASQEKALRGNLDQVRGSLSHPGSKGSVLESAVRKWLRTVLPRSLWVGHGQIIDTNGTISPEHDTVIAFDDHPRFLDEETPQPFFIEGVAAVVEVKAVANVTQLRDTLMKARRLRELQHVWVREKKARNGSVISPEMNDQLAFTAAPPFALFAFESQLPVCKIADVLGKEPCRLLDAVFVLQEPDSVEPSPGGWCALFRAGNFRYQLTIADTPVIGWHHHHDDFTLAAFLTWLTGTINYRTMPSGLLEPYWEAARAESGVSHQH